MRVTFCMLTILQAWKRILFEKLYSPGKLVATTWKREKEKKNKERNKLN